MSNERDLSTAYDAASRAQKQITKVMEEKGIKRLILFREENIRYLSGLRLVISIRSLPGGYSALVEGDHVAVLTPADEYERLKEANAPVDVVKYEGSLAEKLKELVKGEKEAGFEEDSVPYSLYSALSKSFKLINASEIVHSSRAVKNPSELALIERAGSILKKAVEAVPDIYRDGMSEAKLTGELESIMREEGAEGFGTWGLVTSGDGLKYVHYFPRSWRTISGLLNVNLSVMYYGYFADIARVFAIKQVSQETKDLYSRFLDLHNGINQNLKAGTPVQKVVEEAERLFKGIGGSVEHAVGRGVGLELVEKPFLVGGTGEVIASGMAISTNPWFRFNTSSFKLVDTLIVDERGAKLVTGAPYELIAL